jgi:hypothetical protein
VVRGTDCKPISESGCFFDIPLPDGVKSEGRHMCSGPVEDEDEEGECEDVEE